MIYMVRIRDSDLCEGDEKTDLRKNEESMAVLKKRAFGFTFESP